MPDPMSPKNVAAILGVCTDLVYDEIRAGRLRVKRLGGERRPTYLILKAWYREWFEGGEKRAP
jgi:hypothetical protein